MIIIYFDFLKDSLAELSLSTRIAGFGKSYSIKNYLLDGSHSSRTRYCKLCLAQEIPIYKKEWLYFLNPICWKHNCLLLDTCTLCGKDIDLKDIARGDLLEHHNYNFNFI